MSKNVAQFVKFAMTGGVNTAIDFGVFTLLTLWGWPYLAAQAVSYSCGVINSYLMNRAWTFAKDREPSRSRSEFLKFVGVNGVVLFMTSGLMAWLGQHAGWPVWSSKLCVSALGMVVNYTGSRFWVFSQPLPATKRSGI